MSACMGVVGMGLRGQAFTHHLLRSRFRVQGFDVDEQRAHQLHERGGVPVESAAAAARAGCSRRCRPQVQQAASPQELADQDSTAFIEVLWTLAGLRRRV